MQLSFFACALFSATGLLAAGPALAVSTATTTLDLGIYLTDLDPSDGVAPTLVLDPQSRSTAVWGVTSAGATTSWMQQGDSAFGAVSSSGDLDGTGGSASFAGDPLGAGAQIVASAVGGPSLDIGTSAAYVATPDSGQGVFVLGAQTQVTFFGAVTIDWDASNADAATFGEVDFDLWSFVGDGQDLLAQTYATGGYYGDGFGPLSGSTPNGVTMTFANASDTPVTLGYAVEVFANASELEMTLPPVDEPAGAALLLVGVATVLRRVRRQRRRAGR
jgi:hypothetical protein